MTSQQEITLDSITRTCAQLVLDGAHRSPATQILEVETSQIIKRGLSGQQHDDSTAQIRAALDIAKDLEPRKIAAKMRFDVKLADNKIDLVRKNDTDGLAGAADQPNSMVSIVGPRGIPVDPALAALGFETYETLPLHVVTPKVTPRPPGNRGSLHVIQGMLVLLAEAAGLDFYLAHVASLGGIQNFLRDGYERTRKVEFESTPAQIIEFLKQVDIAMTLAATTVEAHGHDMVLVSTPNVPLPVLGYLGTNGVNMVRGAEDLIQKLGLAASGEVTGAQLRIRSAPAADPIDKSAESQGDLA